MERPVVSFSIGARDLLDVIRYFNVLLRPPYCGFSSYIYATPNSNTVDLGLFLSFAQKDGKPDQLSVYRQLPLRKAEWAPGSTAFIYKLARMFFVSGHTLDGVWKNSSADVFGSWIPGEADELIGDVAVERATEPPQLSISIGATAHSRDMYGQLLPAQHLNFQYSDPLKSAIPASMTAEVYASYEPKSYRSVMSSNSAFARIGNNNMVIVSRDGVFLVRGWLPHIVDQSLDIGEDEHVSRFATRMFSALPEYTPVPVSDTSGERSVVGHNDDNKAVCDVTLTEANSAIITEVPAGTCKQKVEEIMTVEANTPASSSSTPSSAQPPATSSRQRRPAEEVRNEKIATYSHFLRANGFDVVTATPKAQLTLAEVLQQSIDSLQQALSLASQAAVPEGTVVLSKEEFDKAIADARLAAVEDLKKKLFS